MVRVLIAIGISLLLVSAARAETRVLVLLAEGFNRQEFWTPHDTMKTAGIAIDIAAPQAGRVRLRTGEDREQDATANLSLDDVQVDRYAMLVIPGGYSPGVLEQFPKSIEIARAFHDAGKPIAAICHGPRLLMRAGLLKDRPMTCLNSVANELADEWVSGQIGVYLDQAIVEDEQFIFSRYPNDAQPFADAIVRRLAGQSPPPATRPSEPAVLYLEDGFDGVAFAESHGWHRLRGETVIVQAPKAWVRSREGHWVQADLVRADASLSQQKRQIERSATEGPRRQAIIALREGFDGRVAIAARFALQARGFAVWVIGPEPGTMVGIDRLPIEVDANYENGPILVHNAIIIAPGGVWPSKDEKARQAKQPAWIDDQHARDTQRLNWLLEQHAAGHTLVLFGFDSLRVGAREQFAGKRFASSEQAVWSFPKGTATFDKALAIKSDERLITARGWDGFAEAMRLALDE